MLSERSFRAQLVMPGQRELFDYWLRSGGCQAHARRSDLDPFKVPRLLPSIGLIDVRNGVGAGSVQAGGHQAPRHLRPGNHRKKRARGVCRQQAEYWRRVHDRVTGRGLPLHGVVRGRPKPRPCSAVLASPATIGRWRPGGSDPLLRRGPAFRERTRPG